MEQSLPQHDPSMTPPRPSEWWSNCRVTVGTSYGSPEAWPPGAVTQLGPGYGLGLPTRSDIELMLRLTWNPDLRLYFCELWCRIHVDPLRVRMLTFTAPPSAEVEFDAWDHVESNQLEFTLRLMATYLTYLKERDPKYVPGDPKKVLPALVREHNQQRATGNPVGQGNREVRQPAPKSGSSFSAPPSGHKKSRRKGKKRKR